MFLFGHFSFGQFTTNNTRTIYLRTSYMTNLRVTAFRTFSCRAKCGERLTFNLSFFSDTFPSDNITQIIFGHLMTNLRGTISYILSSGKMWCPDPKKGFFFLHFRKTLFVARFNLEILF